MRYEDRTDRENLTGDEAAVSRLLGDLRRVEAPPDFDFKLKARIANASPAQTGPPRLVPVMKFAVPLCLLLILVSGFFVLNGTFTTETAYLPAGNSSAKMDPAPEIAATGTAPQAPSASSLPVESEVTAAQAPNAERAAVRPRTRSSSRTRSAVAEDSGGGSIQRDLTISSNTIRPPQSSNPDLSGNSRPHANVRNQSAVEALSSIGVDAEFVSGALKVRAVKSGSSAEIAGLKAGDIVNGIDEKSVEEKTVFDTPFKVRSVFVTREGKTLNLVLNDK